MHTDWHRSIHLFQCLLLILLPLLLLARRVTLPTRLANKSTFSVWQGRCVNGMDTPETGRISVTLQMSVPAQGAERASWLLHYLILLTPAPGTSGVKSQPQCWFERSCYFFFFLFFNPFPPTFWVTREEETFSRLFFFLQIQQLGTALLCHWQLRCQKLAYFKKSMKHCKRG